MRHHLLIKESYLLPGVLLFSFMARCAFISGVEFPFFDEIVHVPTAHNYGERGFLGVRTWYHPNFKYLVMHYSITIFGDNPVGWRLPFIVLGSASVYLLYLLTFKLLDSKKVAIIAAFLLAMDPLHISQSRVNPDETMTVFTSVAGLYLALLYVNGFNPIYLLLAGLVLGIGLSVKWYAVFTIATVLMICAISIRKTGVVVTGIDKVSFIILSLTILPVSVYLVTYYPWFGQGHSLNEFWWLQKDMYAFLQSAKLSDFTDMSKLNASNAYLWFIFPLIKGFKDLTLPQSVIIVPFICNPLVWMLTLPSIGYVMYKCMTERSMPLFILAGAFFMQYVPLLFVNRPVFIHSAMSVLPFSLIAISYTFVQLFDAPKRVVLLKSYLLLNLIFVVLIMPLLLSYPIPEGFYNSYLRWLDMFLS